MIAGLQKMTLLDYPGRIACTVFLQGCNFRCPFCHNSGLLSGTPEQPVSRETLFSFLEKRRGLLDGVCITGGEPTLHPSLAALIADIKQLGFLVKLDTNGSRPQVLQQLCRQGLIDYVAMDIKNSPARYAQTAGLPYFDLAPIEESIAFLLSGTVDYEFRTTVTAQHHTAEDMAQIGRWLCSLAPDSRAEKYFLQPYTDRESVLTGGLSAPEKPQLLAFSEALLPYVHSIKIRGLD